LYYHNRPTFSSRNPQWQDLHHVNFTSQTEEGRGDDEHTIADALGLPFRDLKDISRRLEKVNEIHGEGIFVTVKAGFVELSQANEIAVTPIWRNNENNRLVDSYILDVENAKFLVTKTDTEIGDAYTRMENANRIRGVAYAVTIDSGTYTEKKVESFVLDVDNAKLLVTQLGGKLSIAFCKHLIQCEKKLDQTTLLINGMMSDETICRRVLQLADEKQNALIAERDHAIETGSQSIWCHPNYTNGTRLLWL